MGMESQYLISHLLNNGCMRLVQLKINNTIKINNVNIRGVSEK